MVPDFSVLNLKIDMAPRVLRWGGAIVAHFVLRCPPFVIARVLLIRRPEGDFAVSLGRDGNARLALVDADFRAAVVEAAAAAYDRAAAPLRLHFAVPPVATASTSDGTEHDPPRTPGPA